MAEKHLFTSESVTEGHPDKISDQISDAILDAMIADDETSRVACEVLVTTGVAFVAGEITTNTYVPIPKLVREVIREIGYTHSDYGFDCDTCAVLTSIDAQSPDIKEAVDREGAGDQGLMFGFACRETRQLMPMPIMLAHRLVRRLAEVRKDGTLGYLRPDGKSQVTVEYEGNRPVRVQTVVLSAQHDAQVSQERIRKDLIEFVAKPVLASEEIDASGVTYHINPSGRFVVGGPMGDCGLTGRKIIVDTYGGYGRHGGGAFSGKDPSKVDRSASYAARHIAKNIVAAGLADKVEVQLAYAIGVAEPVSVRVDTFGTSNVSEENLVRAVRENFPLTPRGIIAALGLRNAIYRKTAAYGHFGREEEGFTWEKVDRADALKRSVWRQEPRGAEAELAALLARRPRGLQGDLDPRVVPDPSLALVPASVLLLLERGAGYRMVFTKRTHSVDHHKGEVSFAGGSVDPGDADARATALREAYEEIGLDPGLVTVLGELDELVTVTHFLVTPVVGVVDADPAYLPNPFEVERVLRVPMAHLRESSNWFDDVRTWRGERHVLRSCRYENDVIWGATSRMLQNFLAIVPGDLLP